jgi:hypothetical protein
VRKEKFLMSEQDMTDLVYICDAYDAINTALFGEKLTLGFHEGNFGALSRIFDLIQRNVPKNLQSDDYETMYNILKNTSIPPEERAKMLLSNH